MTELNSDVESTLTRRRLMVSGGAAVAGLYIIGSLPAAASGSAYLRRASYTSYTGAAFTAVSPTGARVTLRLLAVADLARARHTASLVGRDDAFALTFRGPASHPLGSGIRRLRHPSLGWISLFVTPAGRATTTEQDYEVVVDRAAPS